MDRFSDKVALQPAKQAKAYSLGREPQVKVGSISEPANAGDSVKALAVLPPVSRA
ncbi:MAG: hypothetical protein ACRD8U_12665 [Pyrinomonadaceae bacterium]